MEHQWDKNNMFFLTRDGTPVIEITEYDKLFYYGNQRLLDGSCVRNETDEFGRNYTDKLFIRQCLLVHMCLVYEPERFKSLTCKNVDGIYYAKVELTGDIVEGELSHVVDVFEERCKGNGGK